MPTYDYRCAGCRHELEVFQSIREAALRKCPKCGKLKLERLIGKGAGFLFKGGGFYQTDYRSEGYKRAESAERGDGKDASGAAPAKDAGAAKEQPAAAKPEPAKADKARRKK